MKSAHESVRLQRFLAECGLGSRRKMEDLIRKGKVWVNGKIVSELGSSIDPLRDKIQVRGKIVKPIEKGLALFHKPKGVVSTLEDPEGRPTVADYLTKHYQSYFPVGRLDWDSTGLMSLTNDGELAEMLMHPRYGVERIYNVRVEGSVGDGIVRAMARGVKLGGTPVTARAEIISGDPRSTWLEIRVREGRNRVVRRLCERLGHPAIKLRRVRYGVFSSGNLRPGEIRRLSTKDYRAAKLKIASALERKLDQPTRSKSSSRNRPTRRVKTRAP